MIGLGKYKEIYKDNSLPSVLDNISEKEIPQKNVVLRYLKSHKPTAYSPQECFDVVSGEKINEPLSCMDDGVYYWRSDLIYYFEKYNLKLLDEFVDYVIAKT